MNLETGETIGKSYREKETNTKAFWEDILADDTFKSFVENKYRISSGSIIKEDETEDDVDDVYDSIEDEE